MLLVAREQSLNLIDKCAVRKMSKLVAAFPNIVSTRFRNLSNAKITADLVDNENSDDCDWVVYFEKVATSAS
jgi:hypothetical protein